MDEYNATQLSKWMRVHDNSLGIDGSGIHYPAAPAETDKVVFVPLAGRRRDMAVGTP